MWRISKPLRQLLYFPRLRDSRYAYCLSLSRPCCSLLVFPSFLVFPSRLSRRGENPLRTRRVIESAKGKMKRAMMIYLLFEESPGEIAYARAISYVISAVYIYIYIFKKKEREGGIEFYSRQHKPRRSYPIPVKRFCKKARCIKRKRILCNAFLIRDVLERVLLTKCIIMFHEFIYSKLGIFVISPCSSQLPSRRFLSVLLLTLTLSSYFLFQLLRNKFTGIRLSTSREITRLHNEMYTIVISHEPIFPRDGKYNVINLPFCIDK